MSALESRRFFYRMLWITFLLKLAFAAWLPITGDEVYFYVWAKTPDIGFYDHPPMVAWWLSFLLWFGDANWWLRMPAVLLSTGLSYGIYVILRDTAGEQKAILGALLFLFAPLSLVNVLITTDTPLILFSFLSVWTFSVAVKNGLWRWYLVSGVLLGLAFLAKYFAVLLGLTFGLYILVYRRNRNDMLGLFWLFCAVLPFAVLNVWWNYCHCWNNILFNVYNRHGASESYFLDYLLLLFYMITPALLWYGFRERKALIIDLLAGNVFVFIALIPLLFFFILSFKALVGLHWVLAFYPFIFIAVAKILSLQALRYSLKFMMGFSLLHIVAVVVILLMPHDYWKGRPSVDNGMLLGYYTKEFVDEFQKQAPGYQWATGSYVDSGILEYNSGERFIVFGEGSKHGRQDDLLTDWRDLDGKNIAVLLSNEYSAISYRHFFKTSKVEHFQVQHRDRYLILGEGFNYDLYRNNILTSVREKYYRFPDFLPEGECYFNQRYFPNEEALKVK